MGCKQNDWDARFFKYHKENPRVYDLLLKFTVKVRQAGFKHYSMRAIVDRVRWHINIETKSSDGFKINENFTSRYARLITVENPNLEGFFRFRKMRTDTTLVLDDNTALEQVSKMTDEQYKKNRDKILNLTAKGEI